MGMTFGSLFAGIGGIDLGLERAGLSCSWQVEIDPFARRVLAKHWPDVRRYEDVRTFPPSPIEDWHVDLIAGGFPCQPISGSGRKLVDRDERWLWPEFARVVRLLGPKFVLVENVAALLDRGMDMVLSSLAEMGFDAEWGVLSACQFGAPHARERVFLVAYSDRRDGETRFRKFPDRPEEDESRNGGSLSPHWVEPFSGIPGMVDGIPDRVDRLRVIGNSVVPYISEWIGHHLMMEGSRS